MKAHIMLKTVANFPPTHSTELSQLSGVASILRFPLPEPDDSDASDQDD